MNFVNTAKIKLNRSNNSLLFFARVNLTTWQRVIFMVSLPQLPKPFFGWIIELNQHNLIENR
ncbi:hypothetical protein OO7_10302 [Providencia sneebia DSM 19967]|uniref:Uncharacterized protein n=1 Tax=Providencia sneebia DSM 19967 TaxID=1141660 RepID=K8W704_9GAMM|nr:hypothetical protein OO7_10302 [Providencia sneebia DSM 19967]